MRDSLLKFIAPVLVVLVALAFGFIKYDDRIDPEAINAASVLKGRTFDATVAEVKTSSGLSGWLIEDHNIPLVGVSFLFDRTGAAYDPEDKQGLSALASTLLTRGAGRRDWGEISDFMDLNGIKITVSAEMDYIFGHMTVPSEYLEQGLEVLSDILHRPHFDEKNIKTAKLQLKESLKLKQERPEHRLERAFMQDMFAGHVFSRNISGTAEGIENVTRQDLQAFLQNTFARDNLIVGLAGDLTPERAEKIIESVFADLPEKNPHDEIELPIVSFDKALARIEDHTAQVGSIFAAQATPRLAKDFYPLYIANHILGGSGLVSRLSLEAREKRGLTYGIYTYLSVDDRIPMIVGHFSTSAQNFEQMAEILRQEWEKFAQGGVTAEELAMAKDYLLSSYNLRFRSTLGLSDMLVYMQKYNLGADFLRNRNAYVSAVTLEEVNAATKKYFTKPYRLMSLGDFEKSSKEHE